MGFQKLKRGDRLEVSLDGEVLTALVVVKISVGVVTVREEPALRGVGVRKRSRFGIDGENGGVDN